MQKYDTDITEENPSWHGYSGDAIIRTAKGPRTKDWFTKSEYDCAFLGFKNEQGNQTACLSQEAVLQGRQLVPLKRAPLQEQYSLGNEDTTYSLFLGLYNSQVKC